MAKVFIEESTLTAIGDAIRGKEGTSELIPVTDMSNRITNLPSGGGGEVEPIELTGECNYACAGAIASNYIKLFGDTITTKDITTASYMFNKSALEEIPFALNIKNTASSLSSMFRNCKNLKHVPDINAQTNNPMDISYIFDYCEKLETVPKITNAYPSSMASIFSSCYILREIPDDFFSTWNNSRILTYAYAGGGNIFNYCYSLRKIPSSFFEFYIDGIGTSSSYCMYSNLCYSCYSLDEIVGIPVVSATLTSNLLTYICSYCSRLKRFTFKTNGDGTPKTANWKSQTIDLSNYVGYSASGGSYVIGYNSGITRDTQIQVYRDAQGNSTGESNYPELKNHPDAWTDNIYFSRYNHDSAVETINSLPDTSAYLATAGGTNTIKFKGAAGKDTDGGAINTLTAEEIAVATAKGWTVTFG
jgi:hypothetical protein